MFKLTNGDTRTPFSRRTAVSQKVNCFDFIYLTLFRLGFLRVAQLEGGRGECPQLITLKLLMIMK